MLITATGLFRLKSVIMDKCHVTLTFNRLATAKYAMIHDSTKFVTMETYP
jgi:hypothetical protein